VTASVPATDIPSLTLPGNCTRRPACGNGRTATTQFRGNRKHGKVERWGPTRREAAKSATYSSMSTYSRLVHRASPRTTRLGGTVLQLHFDRTAYRQSKTDSRLHEHRGTKVWWSFCGAIALIPHCRGKESLFYLQLILLCMTQRPYKPQRMRSPSMHSRCAFQILWRAFFTRLSHAQRCRVP
jgi:hypothetical protein